MFDYTVLGYVFEGEVYCSHCMVARKSHSGWHMPGIVVSDCDCSLCLEYREEIDLIFAGDECIADYTCRECGAPLWE